MKFNEILLNKKDYYASKKAIPLNLGNINSIVVSYRVKHGDESYKYFIGYQSDDMVRSLCIVLPQMNGYIKYFENGGKNMSFKIEDESVYLKYNEIWNKCISVLNVKLHSQSIYDNKYIKTKVKAFNYTINTLFSEDEFPKEKMHYVCINAICVDSVLREDKKDWFKMMYDYGCL